MSKEKKAQTHNSQPFAAQACSFLQQNRSNSSQCYAEEGDEDESQTASPRLQEFQTMWPQSDIDLGNVLPFLFSRPSCSVRGQIVWQCEWQPRECWQCECKGQRGSCPREVEGERRLVCANNDADEAHEGSEEFVVGNEWGGGETVEDCR